MVVRRRELWLLLSLAVSLGAGLAVREFRAGFPDLSDRLEQLDREEPTSEDTATAAISPPSVSKPSKLRAEANNGPLDINRATAEELQRLPGIGPALADQIVRTRERRGSFASSDDLRAVPGIGPRKLDGIRDLITVGVGREAEGRAGDDAREAEGRVGDDARVGDGQN